MTDPKPATPATDQEIAAWQHDCYTRSACDHGQFGPCLEQNLFARIAADAEKLRAAEQHHRDMLTAVGEEATRQLAAKDEEIERWKELHGNDERCIQNQFTELATLREQVGTLRAALKKLEWSGPNYSEGGIDHGPGCPACGGHKYGTGYAHHELGGHRKNCYLSVALAATEPKG